MGIIFKILLIFVALIVFVPAFRSFMLWLLVGRVLVKEQKKANKQTQRRDGEVKVEKKATNKNSDFRGGEYVDYEEVKD